MLLLLLLTPTGVSRAGRIPSAGCAARNRHCHSPSHETGLAEGTSRGGSALAGCRALALVFSPTPCRGRATHRDTGGWERCDANIAACLRFEPEVSPLSKTRLGPRRSNLTPPFICRASMLLQRMLNVGHPHTAGGSPSMSTKLFVPDRSVAKMAPRDAPRRDTPPGFLRARGCQNEPAPVPDHLTVNHIGSQQWAPHAMIEVIHLTRVYSAHALKMRELTRLQRVRAPALGLPHCPL